MPSTFFTEPPHWRWLIILYFFFGGLAGGCYFVASMLDLMGRPSDRPLARLGYLLAFPTVVVCGILLIADLGRPERFWHMMLQSATWRPMLKTYSPTAGAGAPSRCCARPGSSARSSPSSEAWQASSSCPTPASCWP